MDGQNYASLTKNTCRRLCVTRLAPPPPDFNVEVRKGRPGGVPRKDKMIAPPDPANLGPSNIEIGGAGGGFSEHNNNTPSFTSPNEFRRVVQGFVHLPTEVLSRTIFSGSSGTRVVVGADTEALFGSGGNAPRGFSSPTTSARPLPFWPVDSFFTRDFFHLPLCRPLTTTPQ